MAIHFLALSESYTRVTERSKFRRREVLVEHLLDDFRTGVNQSQVVYEKVRALLQSEDIPFTDRDFRNDKELLRSTYLFLSESDEEARRAMADRISKTTIGYLKHDGITQWSDVLKLTGTSAVASAIPVALSLSPAMVRARLADLEGGARLTALISELVPTIEHVLGENEMLKAETMRFTDEYAELTRRVSSAEDMIKMLEGDNASLEERLAATRDMVKSAHGALLEEIARDNPGEPQLTLIAQRLASRGGGRSAELQRMRDRLPKNFSWGQDKGEILYEEKFVRSLGNFSAMEQEQVVKQLVIFASHGSDYASLHTRKSWMRLPFSPPDCMVSRGADDLRFTWAKNGDINVYWVYRKGDSRVRQSEA